MLGQRYNQRPSDRWFDRENRDSSFNVMSPTGRNRSFKDIHTPRRSSVNSDGLQSSLGNSIEGNNYCRVERGSANSRIDLQVPRNMEGVAYAFTKGPAGQTPFPVLVAMPSYFPQGTYESSSPSQSSQSKRGHSRKPSLTVHPGLQRFDSSEESKSIRSNRNDVEFWSKAYPSPTDSPQPLSLDQVKRWNSLNESSRSN
ncbi:hypothetical protein BGZ76_003885 [Entomortierella beljakovae]|nr:hypothetical protein BGZ76_003885 [Entomortierella beljakovae]